MNTFSDLIKIILDLIKLAVPVLVGIALLVFFLGLTKFIFRLGGDEKAVTEGKSLIIWGLVALFIMVSIWGLLRFVYGEFGFPRPFGTIFLPH